MFGRHRTPSVHPFLLMLHINCPIAWISSPLVLYRVPYFSHFGKEIISHVLIRWIRWIFQNLLLPALQEVCDNSNSVTPFIVMKNDGVLHPSAVIFFWVLDEGGAAGIVYLLPWRYSVVHITPSLLYATMNITFTAHCLGHTFFGQGELGCFHSFDWHFKFDLFERAQVLSMATVHPRKSSPLWYRCNKACATA